MVGIDVDPHSIELASAAAGDVRYVLGDFLSYELAAESFDVVTSVATLHHMDAGQALLRMREILRPGGVLAVVGLARRTAADLPYDAAGFLAHHWQTLRHGYWQHPSPIADPTLTLREIRSLVANLLPGARVRRHVLFRYSIIWTRPDTALQCP